MTIPPEYELEELETVETFSSPWEAQLAKAALESEGIEAVIADENLLRLYSALSNVIGGVRVRVRPGDLERARAFLADRRPLPAMYLVKEGDYPGLEEPEPVPEREPVRHPDLVTVARFPTPWMAHLARTRLEAGGVEACVFEERFPPVDLLTGADLALNRVAVQAADESLAREILEQELLELPADSRSS
jgi:hypothetical protein